MSAEPFVAEVDFNLRWWLMPLLSCFSFLERFGLGMPQGWFEPIMRRGVISMTTNIVSPSEEAP